MHALISVLDDPHYHEVERLWRRLEGCCDLGRIRLTPLPHLSWQVAERYHEGALLPALNELSAEFGPLTVRTVGLGIFSGASPVLYLPVVKDRHLLERHAQLWEKLAPHGEAVSPHYHPDAWVPHVTLAYGDITAAQLALATERLAGDAYDWQINLDNLALVCQEGDEVGELLQRVPLA